MATGPRTVTVLLVLGACATGALLGLTSAPTPAAEVEMAAQKLVRVTGGQFLLVLAEKHGPRRLAIPVTHAEAALIQGALSGARGLAPATLAALGGRVLRASIDDALSLRDYRGHLVVGNGSREFRLDASAGEALSLALQAGATIVVDRLLLEEAGVSPDDLRGIRARSVRAERAPPPALGI